ncbi:MAG: sigma-54-dependent Fis family transcriptional regulator, partial [Candidatus Cloacimonetes bacterium]|nr:sigma-54-dependent Fis family transcriptional regulator [Candidatus Cloacimonadota bacterium]
MESILIIDDNEEFVDDLVHVLRRSFQCETADTGEKGLEQIERQEPDLVLLDYDLGAGASGLEILEKLVARHPEVPVIMVTKESGVRTVVRAMKSGAFDYLVKNTSRDEFIEVIRKGLSLRQVKQENTILRRALKQSLGRLVGDSEAIRTLKRQIQEAASTELTVTITGETGTGKTLIARLIHEGSERGRQPFIDVNVSAIEKELFNSEVYGHEKGSFTGAVGTKKGLVELAHRG